MNSRGRLLVSLALKSTKSNEEESNALRRQSPVLSVLEEALSEDFILLEEPNASFNSIIINNENIINEVLLESQEDVIFSGENVETGAEKISCENEIHADNSTHHDNDTNNSDGIIENRNTANVIILENQNGIIFGEANGGMGNCKNESSAENSTLKDDRNSNDGGDVFENEQPSSDTESSQYVSESEEQSSDSGTSHDDSEKENTSSLRKVPARKRRKLLKDSGQEYVNTVGRVICAKKIKPNPCLNKKCQNKCNSFSEDERQRIFTFYWNLKDSIKQKNYLNDCIKISQVKRRRPSKNVKIRRVTNEYYLKKDHMPQRVCKQFLLQTLCITVRLLRTVISNKTDEKFPEADLRGKHRPYNKTSDEQIRKFKHFVESLPAVPSHYCRSSSTKKYLPADIKSFNNVYRMYVAKCESEDTIPLKKSKFLQLFKNYNIGIHVPKKDKCIKCMRFENLPEDLKTPEEITAYGRHVQEKDAIKEIFLEEQKHARESDVILVASFDLQKVLTTPHGDNMLLGFSRKYAVFNFTVYETTSKKGYCYLWGEKDGRRGSNEICSNLLKYLKKIDSDGKYRKVSLYCDNCSGQNKNKSMLLMLRYFLDNSAIIEEITLTFLIAGHTYLPVDSMHAIIERSLKNTVVQAPSEWPTILRNARSNPEPYEVYSLGYSDFLDFKGLVSEKPLKIRTSAIKTVSLSKNSFYIKYSNTFLNKDLELLEFRLKDKNCHPKAAYSSCLPINKLKLENLQTLCKNLTIKPEYHYEYLTLKSHSSIPDVLEESDIEDHTS